MTDQEFKITPDEVEKFQESMKNPEFKKLFFDYMQEISDPKNKELYEKELAQLELEKGYKVRYVKPEPCFVVKSDVYVNICSSPEIQECSSVKSNWSIPYSLSKPRKEQKNGKELDIYDCVFHPETIKKCTNEKFRDLVVSVALEGIDKQFNVNVSKKAKIIKGKKSEGTPLMTMIRERDETLPVQQDTSLELVEQLVKEKPNFDIPKFKIIHQQRYDDYQRFTGARVASHTSRPDSLVVKIELPKVDSAKEIDLDIQSNTLDLSVGSMYCLHLDLPFPVITDKGIAKFDKQKRVLNLTLPVEQPAVEMTAVAAEEPSLVQDIIDEKGFDEDGQEELLDQETSPVDAPLEEIQTDTPVGNSNNHDSPLESIDTDGSALACKVNSKETVNEEVVAKGIEQLQLDSTLDASQDKLDQKSLVEDLAQLAVKESTTAGSDENPPVGRPEIKEIFTTPQFTAHQSDEIATLIIKVEKVDPTLVQVTQHPRSFVIQFPNHEKSYKLHLDFEKEYKKYHLNVSEKNVCVLLYKSVPEHWTHLTLAEAESTSILSFLSLDNVPFDPAPQVATTPMEITAKQKKDFVVAQVKPQTALPPPPVQVVEPPKFVNNLLFDLD